MPKLNPFIAKLGDDSVPIPHRASMLIDVLAQAQGGDLNSTMISQEIFHRITEGSCDEVSKKRAEQLKAILQQLQNVPLRPATFIQLQELDQGAPPHALVSLDNGELAFVVVHDHATVSKLKLGDRVMVDGAGKILVHPTGNGIHTGSESRLQRLIDDRHLEVVDHHDENRVVLAGPELMAEVKSGKIPAGSMIVVGAGGRLATHAIPPEDSNADNFRFLDRGPVPDVIVERDIGAPPPVIAAVAQHIREEMTRPELRRRFKLRPCLTKLLMGVSGSGKTLAIQAMHRLMYEIMSEVTAVPMEALPKQVFRFRNSQMLSMWLGESDKNADRLFDEVERRAAQTYTTQSGMEFQLPVLVVMEEADGMGRARGEEAIYDRILTTILQRLDPNRKGLSDKLVVFLSTTNEPHIVDPALLRRIGGSVEVFGRLNQEAFGQVLGKHVAGLPVEDGRAKSAKAWKSILGDINDWLFVEGVDRGVVELIFQGQHSTAVRYHRDFLTGALVDRSVQQAATQAWEESLRRPTAGITRDHLKRAIQHQVRSVACQLTPHNVGHYLDIPEGARVANIRSLLPQD